MEHTSDALIEAYGKNLNEAFDNAGRALVDTMLELSRVRGPRVERLEVEGEGIKELLYNWLEAVLIKVSSEQKAFRAFRVRIAKQDGAYRLTGVGSWEPFDPTKHQPKLEAKAVTFHMMEVTEAKRRVTLRFLLDL